MLELTKTFDDWIVQIYIENIRKIIEMKRIMKFFFFGEQSDWDWLMEHKITWKFSTVAVGVFLLAIYWFHSGSELGGELQCL